MPHLQNLHTLLLHELRDLYDAEHRIAEALPRMRKAAHSEELKKAFEEHLEQTEGQTRRLEQAFAALGEPVRRETCPGIRGILEEGDQILDEEGGSDDARDAALIGAARRVEHYEMAGYASAWTLAQTMRHNEVADLLEQTREEEENTDKRPTKLAAKTANLALGDIASGIVS